MRLQFRSEFFNLFNNVNLNNPNASSPRRKWVVSPAPARRE
jgi:hypothetical protein